MAGGTLIVELADRLSGKVIISSDVTDADLKGVDLESLIAHVTTHFAKEGQVNILDKHNLLEILDKLRAEEKQPVHVEIIRSADFKPMAKEIDASFSTRNVGFEKTTSGVADFAEYFNDRYRRLRELLERNRVNTSFGMVNKIENLSSFADGREVTVVGIVYDKIITKKGHLMITLEDETGTAKIIVYKQERERGGPNNLFDSANRVIVDEVVAVNGKTSGPFVVAKSLVWPDIPIRTRKNTEQDLAIAFLSDIHIGSKLFMEKHFEKFLEWINGGVDARKDLVSKVKYMVLAGDLVDGIGVYPNQDKELEIVDVYKQYSVLFDYLSTVPDYIEIFVLPGNHDAVQRAEPQPPLTTELMSDFKKDNIHILSNPAYITMHGLKTLSYHGTSLDSVIHVVPGSSYTKPEAVMVEMLKRRHLSPVYGGNVIVPSKKDPMVISEVPDILHMGHIHKNGSADYHGTLAVNSGTFQSKTSYQMKQGHLPTPGILSVYETRGMNMNLVDFNRL